MRALQRENGVAGQRTADLRERLNFQCFKYELLVDMGAHSSCGLQKHRALPCPAPPCLIERLIAHAAAGPLLQPAMRHALGALPLSTTW